MSNADGAGGGGAGNHISSNRSSIANLAIAEGVETNGNGEEGKDSKGNGEVGGGSNGAAVPVETAA